MAYGQIDPARLSGQSLARWYLRSPADVEHGRQTAASQRYADFFGNSDQSANELDGAPYQSSLDAGAAEGGEDEFRPGEYRASFDDRAYRPGHEKIWLTSAAVSPWTCASCHLPPPLPPQLQPLWPLFRRGSSEGGRPASEPRREKYPQCERQERQDRGICAQQPTKPAKAVCNASATERRVWCEENQGTTGSPDLYTARRRDGRRWP